VCGKLNRHVQMKVAEYMPDACIHFVAFPDQYLSAKVANRRINERTNGILNCMTHRPPDPSPRRQKGRLYGSVGTNERSLTVIETEAGPPTRPGSKLVGRFGEHPKDLSIVAA